MTLPDDAAATLPTPTPADGAGGGDPPEAAAFPPAMRLRLPNGMTIVPQSRVEAEHFYEDLFEKQIYLRHGVTLAPGDCVVDVGGNIGTFALFAHRHAPGARIYTFEPAPPLFRRLAANLALNGVPARAFPFGIGDSERVARFTFYPNSSGMSSFHADAAEERDVLRAMMRRSERDGVEGMGELMEFAEELLDERFQAVEMECRIRPLSAVIREEGITRIDLLKVDVQKAEAEVLQGIEDEHWPLVRQIVMEVHDLDGRLAEVTRLLESRGFRVAVEQDEAVEGTVLYNLFGVRETAGTLPPLASHEPAPTPAPAPATRAAGWHLLLLSAATPAELDQAAGSLAAHLRANPGVALGDVAFTLRQAPAHACRRALVVREGDDVAARLRAGDSVQSAGGEPGDEAPSPVFLFPGVGEQYPGMARGLYAAHPVFREEVDRCATLLAPLLGFDLREVLFAEGRELADTDAAGAVDLRRMLGREAVSPAAERLNRTEAAQPAAFVVGYALARLWQSWGVQPQAVMGHSLGEYTAACVAGVVGLEDALEMVALRAGAIQALPGGAMLAVPLSAGAIAEWLGEGVALAAVNAPELCVLAGGEEAVARVERGLAGAGHASRRLAAAHAFHSPAMRPVAERIGGLAARVALAPPQIPLVSNVTGGWLGALDAQDPSYWARHLTSTVQFARGAATLLAGESHVLLEMGPGGSLTTFIHQQAAALERPAFPAAASLPHAADDTPDGAHVLAALGRLWAAGVQPDWTRVAAMEGARKVSLPDPPSPGSRGAPEPEPEQPGAEPARETEVVQVLTEMWRELLHVDAGPGDDFFLLGGHSLTATKLIAAVRDRFGVAMRLRTLFQTRTIAKLAAWIESEAGA